jgi:hypothetical protein
MALALWFKERVSRNGGRLKKPTIVALARKLLGPVDIHRGIPVLRKV